MDIRDHPFKGFKTARPVKYFCSNPVFIFSALEINSVLQYEHHMKYEKQCYMEINIWT